ncbi:MAG: BrnT family toxin [Anaerolineales bacterium]|nr:BrnT family toxin [Anaerolineales bacterium]
MRIDQIVIPVATQDKLISKHGVTVEETRFVLLNQPRIRFAEKGYQEGENVYAAFGQTFGGRYLVLFFVYKPQNDTAIIISARDMSRKERRQYGRK